MAGMLVYMAACNESDLERWRILLVDIRVPTPMEFLAAGVEDSVSSGTSSVVSRLLLCDWFKKPSTWSIVG